MRDINVQISRSMEDIPFSASRWNVLGQAMSLGIIRCNIRDFPFLHQLKQDTIDRFMGVSRMSLFQDHEEHP